MYERYGWFVIVENAQKQDAEYRQNSLIVLLQLDEKYSIIFI